MKYSIGVDIGGTTIKFGLFNIDGQLMNKAVIPTVVEKGASGILDDIADQVLTIMRDMHVDRSELLGVGVGVPGPVIDESFVSTVVNLDWDNVDCGKGLSDRLGMPVKVANDANAAALGEVWQGAGHKYRKLVLITLGTGIGGGIINDGVIISGSNGAGGEIGHMSILDDPAERCCGCGKHDCFELVASATGIVDQARKLLVESDEPSTLRHYNGAYDARAIFMAAANHDALSQRVVDNTAKYIGRAYAMIGCVVDPDVFVIGGGVSNAGEQLLSGVREHYRRYAFEACRETPIIRAMLGNDAGIFGAAKLML